MCREYGATLVQIDTAQENNWIMKNFPKGTNVLLLLLVSVS